MSITIRVGSFQDLMQFALPIRYDVFVMEQRVPVELERDARDELCRHVVIFDEQIPTATGRIDIAHRGKLGRIAVTSSRRNQGLGRLIVEALEREALRLGLKETSLHAQVDVIEFYRKLGYVIVSDEFEEAGIRHRKMTKQLGATP